MLTAAGFGELRRNGLPVKFITPVIRITFAPDVQILGELILCYYAEYRTPNIIFFHYLSSLFAALFDMLLTIIQMKIYYIPDVI